MTTSPSTMITTISTTTNARQRNLLIERLAHALPYVLFAAALLLLDSIGRGATQEEFFRSVQDSVNNTGPDAGGGVTLRGFMMFLGAVGLVVALAILNQKLKGRARASKAAPARTQSKPTGTSQPRKLVKEIAKAAGLSGDELRQLKTAAEERGYANPLTLLICPSLLIDAARRDDTAAEKAVLARVARRIAAR